MFAHPENSGPQLAGAKLATPTTRLGSLAIGARPPKLDAVIIRSLTYSIGRGATKKTILNKINLTVPEGSIYGLLGPSGCGKTTMLKCVVGRLRPRTGSVLVFGLRPGLGRGEVPGRDVGYMPQELSVYEDFTIEETLTYFGKINRMRSSEISKRIDFLIQFLDLPSRKRQVVNLSGGQKRRVSLAAALVHSPPLLILDEPTVGVDPLLRQNIWQHLVALTRTERISVIITTHYIEEARLAHVVGLMRYGQILAEGSPDELMHLHGLANLEDVFLKLCVIDSTSQHRKWNDLSRAEKSASRPTGSGTGAPQEFSSPRPDREPAGEATPKRAAGSKADLVVERKPNNRSKVVLNATDSSGRSSARTEPDSTLQRRMLISDAAPIQIHTGTNRIELRGGDSPVGYINEAVEEFSSEDDYEEEEEAAVGLPDAPLDRAFASHNLDTRRASVSVFVSPAQLGAYPSSGGAQPVATMAKHRVDDPLAIDDYLGLQAMHWAARRSNALNFMRLSLDRGPYNGLDGKARPRSPLASSRHKSSLSPSGGMLQWLKTLLAVTWKNYVRLRRNPPVLVFQFVLPAIQVMLFCLCIGGEPFDVPVAIVNDEAVAKSSLQFLRGLDKKIIRQVPYDNLTSATEAVRRGQVWGVLHIPDKYSENLQSRLIMGEEVTNDTISNGTIRVYPDLTNLHLAMTLQSTFRETFIEFARNSLEELGYDRSLADMPIQIGKPIYGTANKDGYLEFMAPGVVISITYVMATGLTALAFILERRDGLLERSLVSGVQTMQILLAHAINQIFVMVIQIFLVLGCTFFIFEIPSRGPFVWVVLLILLQGCTGMSFGLLVSAVCAEENTAVMMVVGTFYTNLILAGIIWPIEAMPRWLRPVSYAQPQTLPTETLRHILSRGWGIGEPAVLLGFGVTVGWLVVFLVTAGAIFKYSRS